MLRILILTVGLVACAGPAFEGRPLLSPESVTDGVIHRTGTFEARDGLTLFRQSWTPANTPPRATLVIMHGLKDYSGRYAEVAQRLATHGIAVEAFDLRGHGQSEGRRVVVDTFEDYLADLDDFILRIHGAAGSRPVFVFGHSMGGAIVVGEILEHHPQVSGVILSGAALKHDLNGFEEVNVKLLGAVTPMLAILELADADFSSDPAIVAAMANDPLIYDGSGPAHTAAELVSAIDRADARFEDFGVPVLILHGAADKVTPPSGSEALFARAKSSDKRLLLYEGFKHDLMHEPERERVLKDVEAWIDERVK